jgi:hypothetical protein
MPTVDVEDNIKRLQVGIEQMTQEIFRMQGMLSTFQGFKNGGLKTIDLPNDPNQPPVEKPVEKPVENTHSSISGGEILTQLMANPSMMASAAAAMTSLGKDPNQEEELESTQENPE